MDVLTDVLRTARVQGEVFGCLDMTAPWGLRLGNCGGAATFHAVLHGDCWVRTGARPVRAVSGEFLLIPSGQAHDIADSATTPAVPVTDIQPGICRTRGLLLRHGGGGAGALLLSGRYTCGAGVDNPLFPSLPPLIRVGFAGDKAVGWLQGSLHALAEEVAAGKPGWQTVGSRLADVLLVHALRSHVDSAGLLPGAGWLRGLDDPELSEVLHLIHERPAEPWTVAGLASRVHMSRSAFAARFKAVVRKAPLDYLMSWRMQLAAARLRQRDGTSLAELAREVGYDTDAAFGKAFKRVFGRTPGQFRRAAQEPVNGHQSVLQAELKKRDPFELPEQEVGLNLVRTTFHFGRESAQLFERHKLANTQYNILRILRGMGVAASPDEISQRLLVPAADFTDHLTALTKRRLIARVSSRDAAVRITPAGLRILAALDEPVLAMHRRQLGHLSAAELDELNRLLVKARGAE